MKRQFGGFLQWALLKRKGRIVGDVLVWTFPSWGLLRCRLIRGRLCWGLWRWDLCGWLGMNLFFFGGGARLCTYFFSLIFPLCLLFKFSVVSISRAVLTLCSSFSLFFCFFRGWWRFFIFCCFSWFYSCVCFHFYCCSFCSFSFVDFDSVAGAAFHGGVLGICFFFLVTLVYPSTGPLWWCPDSWVGLVIGQLDLSIVLLSLLPLVVDGLFCRQNMTMWPSCLQDQQSGPQPSTTTIWWSLHFSTCRIAWNRSLFKQTLIMCHPIRRFVLLPPRCHTHFLGSQDVPIWLQLDVPHGN